MKKKHLYNILLMFVVFNFCSEPKIDIPEYEIKIAVDGFIEAGKPPLMYLSYSSPFISSYDSIDFVNMIKLNVSAYVITEEKDTIGFTRQTATDHYPPFKYTMSPNDLVAEAGKSYQLLIKKRGIADITAITSIPKEGPKVQDIEFIPIEPYNLYGHYKITITNSAEPQYFFIQNKKFEEDNFYPVKFPCKSDRFFDSNELLEFMIQYRKKTNLWEINKADVDSTFTDRPLGAYWKLKRTTFKISSINEESFELLGGIFLDTEFHENSFKPISQLPKSNVSNGIGHWTGIHSLIYDVKSNY